MKISLLHFCLIPLVPAVVFLSSCNRQPGEGGADKSRKEGKLQEVKGIFATTEHHRAVLEMNPAGFWPADDGAGNLLLDLSDRDNHARIFNVPWENGLLNFTSGFQWVEIPPIAEYRKSTISIGGWFYTRRGDYCGAEAMDFGTGKYPHVTGVSLINSAYDGRGAWVYFGAKDLTDGLGIRLRRANGGETYDFGTFLDVVHGNRADVVGSGAAGVDLTPKQWHHVLYSVDGSVARLYLDGKLVGESDDVAYSPSNLPFLIGNDMAWWMLHPVGSQSLDGSVRDLVVFDRALSPAEVAKLAAMKPDVEPATLPEGPDPEPFADASIEELIAMVENRSLPDADRALAGLQLASRGPAASAALPVLRKQLEEIQAREGRPQLPKVEEIRRNSLIAALLAIGNENPQVRELLGEVLARPFLEQADLSQQYLSEVAAKVEENDLMGALEIYGKIPHDSHGDFFFSEGDIHRDQRDINSPNERAYAPVAESNGITYRVGKGIPWDSAEHIPPGDFEYVVYQLPEEFREAAFNWEHAQSNHLYFVKIYKTLPDGTEEEAVLEGDWFVFEGSDQKLRGWTIDIDSEGYIHLLGGMHNRPNPSLYIPGSWEMMGLSRGQDQPTTMYWVSKRPGDISEFEFVGQPDNPRNLPSAGMNYMNFIRDKNNNMFLYGRISVQGIQSWGFFRYDTKLRQWLPIGGDAREVFADTRDAHGDIFLQRQGRPWEPAPPRANDTVFVWTWQPHFYNYIRSWGARFDKTGRLHIRMLHRGLAENSRIVDSIIYAYSDDLGQNWHRADGTLLRLPLTLNPAPHHNADEAVNHSGRWWDLWISLLNRAGYRSEDADVRKF